MRVLLASYPGPRWVPTKSLGMRLECYHWQYRKKMVDFFSGLQAPENGVSVVAATVWGL